MVGSNAALLEHTKEEYNKAKDDEELIKGIYHLNDGEYLEMPDDVEALVWMIKIQQRWDLFVKVLESLQYYPYQGCIIHYVRTVEECASIINQLHGCQHEKVLRHLMRERVFSLLQNEETSLKTNAEGGLQERWVSTATELYDKWKKTKDGILKDFVKEWMSVFGAENLGVWASGKQRQTLGKAEQFKTFEFGVLDVIDKNIKSHLAFDNIDYGGKTCLPCSIMH